MANEKVGDVVWYTIREQAEILTINGSTEATVCVVTGPQKGQGFTAPWGILGPVVKSKI